MRDLFQGDDGGWLQDVALVDRLVAEKLEREAEAIRAEGWKWIEVAPEFAYGHTYGLRQLRGEEIPLTAEEQAARDALQAEYERLEETYAEADELPEEVDQRLAEIETALAAFDERPVHFDPAEIARAGAFVSIDGSGNLRVERGYVRPEDEAPVEPERGQRTQNTMASGQSPHRWTLTSTCVAGRTGKRGGAGRGRGSEAHSRPADDRAHRASHSRASPCARRAT